MLVLDVAIDFRRGDDADRKDGEIQDMMPNDPGGRHDIVPDPHAFKSVNPGPKSKARAEGKSVVYVGAQDERQRLRQGVVDASDARRREASEGEQAEFGETAFENSGEEDDIEEEIESEENGGNDVDGEANKGL
ncbi:hypothetical protein B0A50_07413 [Salinomyces thailandicus]|uniref:Uncharacterized protein n=1 Tax=Salinomyces thailandicus TaxID=706561 RepID=A0A4U0TMU3_9PEZI|nr:hypothetical protein B0A50_07413 [Salinomyces thailandica]